MTEEPEVKPENQGGSLSEFVTAKVTRRMYELVKDAANLLATSQADFVRRSLALHLQVLGYDVPVAFEADVVARAKARAEELRSQASAAMPDLVPAAALDHLREVSRQPTREMAAVEFKTPRLQVFNGNPAKAQQVAAAVRMWRNPATRIVIQVQVDAEANKPKFPLPSPPLLLSLRGDFASYAALRDALIEETGVAA